MIERSAPRLGSLLPALLPALLAALLAATGTAQDPRALKALDQWLGLYLAGKLDLSKPRITKNSPGVRGGIVPERSVGTFSHLDELEAICRAVAVFENAEAIDRLLDVAAVGLAGLGKGGIEQRTHLVRLKGEAWVDRIATPDALKRLEELANDKRASQGTARARRAAAIKALGRRADEMFRPFLETGLRDGEAEIRLAAAEACAVAKLKTTLPALVEQLSAEKDELVLTAGLDAMLAIVGEHRENSGDDALRRTADVAVLTLGRGSWRSDLAAVELLERVRSAQSVPALIEVLGRFGDGVDRGRDESVSGRLRERTWEVLVSLTGARFPSDRADQWRSWWDSVKAEFVVAEVKSAAPDGEGRTVTGDFFGIPIRGSRVLFVVDASGSMSEPWRGDPGTTSAGRGDPKIAVAKAELLKAVDKLTADCSFNLVWFGNGAEVWQKDMVPADAKNKLRFTKVVDDLRADGGTNLWQGLRDGLKLESLVYGSRYGATYDQLFVLSDGLPTVGEVQAPAEILALVRETNRYSRLRIDTVYISGDPQVEKRHADIVGMSGTEFMKKLAEQNGGVSIGF
jgi:hypothetical protein